MVEPKDMYDATRVFYPKLTAWEDLPSKEKDEWQERADEINAKDMEGVNA